MNQELNLLSKDIFKNPLNLSAKKEDVPELLNQLQNGVSSLMKSENYKNYLDYLSSFYQYSFRNVLLMLFQNPDASQVGSYTFWKQHNRYVKKGEHGMKILAPCIYKSKKEKTILDKEGLPVKGKDGLEKKELVTESRITGFRFATVFDISQTEGEELPNILKKLEENTPISKILIKSVSEISELPIEYQQLEKTKNGYTNGKKIVIQSGMSSDQTAKTLLHEYTHSIYHKNITDYKENRSSYEIQAESTAYIVSKHFGLDTSNYTFGYVTSWANGKSLSEYEESLKKINDMSTEIISKIESNLDKEYEKNEIKNQLLKSGFTPTEKVLDKIITLNQNTGNKNTLLQIKNLANKEKNNKLATDICKIFKKQEIKKSICLEP